MHELTAAGVGLRVLAGQGAAIDTTTAGGKLIFGIFAALAEFERELIVERTRAGLASARARGRIGGRKPKMTAAKLRLVVLTALKAYLTALEDEAREEFTYGGMRVSDPHIDIHKLRELMDVDMIGREQRTVVLED